MWARHDVYSRALDVIVSGSLRQYVAAGRVRSVGWDAYERALEDDCTYDHRNLRDLHDHLTAVWRLTFRHTQPSLLPDEESARWRDAASTG